MLQTTVNYRRPTKIFHLTNFFFRTIMVRLEEKHMKADLEKISPEGLEVAKAYLENKQDTLATARALNLPLETVEALLNKRETKNFIDRIYYEAGFRSRDRMGQLMDEIISSKLQEMEETGVGSSKDIIEILALAHKMKMDQMAMEIKLLELKNKAPAIQINQQNNISGGDKYNQLLDRILNVGNT